MQEWIDRAPNVDVAEAEYIRLLGYPPGRILEGRALELAGQTRAWFQRNARPWLYVRKLDLVGLDEDALLFEGRRFSSPYLLRQFREVTVDSAYAVAVSAGPECEARASELWKAGKPDEYFFMEMYGGAVVERLIMEAGSRLCGWAEAAGKLALPHYSPGYPEWEVSEQVALLELICQGARQPLPGSLECFDTGMLRPKKSLLAVIGVTGEVERASRLSGLLPCQRCALRNCAYRRKPYLFAEDMRDAINDEEDATRGPTQRLETQLNPTIRYSTNPRALRKWSEERLEVSENPDGSVEARFRYEGSTCSNMGHPLEFVYDIRVSGPANGFRIERARCAPKAEDNGHAKMCEYLKRGDAFMDQLRAEAPLLGQSLDSVGEWNPQSSYAGCFCEQAARDHKWRMAYEVLHYALCQRQQFSSAELARRGN